MKFEHVSHKSMVEHCPRGVKQALVYIQMLKLMSIVCVFLFVLLPTANAQNTEIISYKYEEGIKLSKETGKPILIIPHGNAVDRALLDERIINKMNNDFIFINSGSIGSKFYKHDKQMVVLSILDSNGREITYIQYKANPEGWPPALGLQFDSDGNEISVVEENDRDWINFIFNVLEYSLKKEGEIQRLPSEKTASVNELLETDDIIIATTKGYIRDLKRSSN